jgi:Holliday junction resolvase-like predicted endonuclease
MNSDNLAGRSTLEMAERRRMIRRKLGTLGLLALAEVILIFRSLPAAVGFPISMLGIWAVDHYFIGWMDHVFKRENDARRGAEGEEMVAAILNRLPDSYVALHDVSKPFGNIDHIVFRKDGAVFLIETKSHRGRVTESSATQFLKQTHANIYWLCEFLQNEISLRVWISTAVVFTNAFVNVRRPLGNVNIIHAKFLERWMARIPGNAQVARELWPKVELIKHKLRTEPHARYQKSTS